MYVRLIKKKFVIIDTYFRLKEKKPKNIDA